MIPPLFLKGIVVETGSFPPHCVVNVVAIRRVGSSFLYYTGDRSISGFTFSRVFLHGSAQSKTQLWIILFYVGSFLLIHKQKGRAGDDSFYTNACLLIALPQLPGNRLVTSFSSKNQCCSFLYAAKSITPPMFASQFWDQSQCQIGGLLVVVANPHPPVPGWNREKSLENTTSHVSPSAPWSASAGSWIMT